MKYIFYRHVLLSCFFFLDDDSFSCRCRRLSSEQTQGGVPRIFLEAHEEFGPTIAAGAGGSDTENKNDSGDGGDGSDGDEVEVLRRVESNSKETSSPSSPPSPHKKARRSSSPKENKDGGVIDLC